MGGERRKVVLDERFWVEPGCQRLSEIAERHGCTPDNYGLYGVYDETVGGFVAYAPTAVLAVRIWNALRAQSAGVR
jgi:hypothetical protein